MPIGQSQPGLEIGAPVTCPKVSQVLSWQVPIDDVNICPLASQNTVKIITIIL